MSKARSILLLSVLALSVCLTVPAQTGSAFAKATLTNSDDQVLNAPYSAERHFISIDTKADGMTNRTETGGSEARDSQGRTYSMGERLWTYIDHGKSVLKREMLYKVDDPVANTEMRWDSTSKQLRVIHFPKNTSEGNAPAVACPSVCFDIDDSFFKVEKLGHRMIEGVEADGERKSYTVPIGQDHNDRPIVMVHETWYCPELKIIVRETNSDPRSGQTTSQLLNIIRGEPDVSKYRPPTDYIVNDVQASW